MSYNTRRTGSGGQTGQARTTQVNYHQQPAARTTSTPVQPRSTAGYTTAQPQQPAGYNSAAQPAFSTQQPAFTTQPPPPPKTQQPAPPQPKTPSQQPTAPRQTQQFTPNPAVKPEPVTPQGTPQPNMDVQESADDAAKRNGHKRRFPKIPPKVRKARMNAKMRRLLVPKSALNLLQELRPSGCKFAVTEEPGWGFTCVCSVDNKSFTGHGPSIAKAKLQASEQALRYLWSEELSKAQVVKNEEGDANTSEPMETEGEGEEGEPRPKRRRVIEEDPVPWCSLAAYALHKLYEEWHGNTPQGPIEKLNEEEEYYSSRPSAANFFNPPKTGGFGPGPRPPFPPGRGRGFGPFPGPPPRGHPHHFGMPLRPPPAANFLGGAPGPKPMPMKKMPENASSMHPVMLLNQMKPNLIYKEAKEGREPNHTFVMSVVVDGKEYVGRGKTKKVAKKEAAEAALIPLGFKKE